MKKIKTVHICEENKLDSPLMESAPVADPAVKVKWKIRVLKNPKVESFEIQIVSYISSPFRG